MSKAAGDLAPGRIALRFDQRCRIIKHNDAAGFCFRARKLCTAAYQSLLTQWRVYTDFFLPLRNVITYALVYHVQQWFGSWQSFDHLGDG